MMQLSSRLSLYIDLMRLNKPIGILLLLWPTLWALWLASNGIPSLKLLFIFILGTILMRSAGCIVNDLADRKFDRHVVRTKTRPLAQGAIGVIEALALMVLLGLAALVLVSFCNLLTIKLAILGVIWAALYPFTKRWIDLPQAILGIAFSWGVPMAFAAVNDHVSGAAWFLFLACVIWPIIYDTMYAMVDREDDRRIGIKSSAILFGGYDRQIIALLQGLFLAMLSIVGQLFHKGKFYYVALMGVGLLFVYQQWLIRNRDRDTCFAAFLNQRWVGMIIFLGIIFL